MGKNQRIVRKTYPLSDLPTLQGKRLKFGSIAEMFTARAHETPNDTLVLYYEEVVTYSLCNDRANKVANYLKKMGVNKGDIVSVMILNSPEIYYTMFGAQKLGAIAGPINYMLKGPEIAYVLEDSRPKVAFVGSDYMAEFARGWNMSTHKPTIVEVQTGIEHGTNVSSAALTDIFSQYNADECLVPQSLDDPFLLLYSSGTTGMPKGILISNKNQFSVCRDMASMGLNRPGDVMMIILPMFHTNPLCVFTYPYIYQGLTLCIRKTFSPSDFWPSITRYGVTVIMAVPAMYAYVFNTIDPKTIDYRKLKLKYAFAGAAPIPIDLVRGFKERFGVQIIDGYGLTEATGVTTTSYNIPENLGSVGIPLASQEVEIMDNENNILPYGEDGEICIRGDAVMMGYLNKPEATAEAIKDGWLHTGDMGRMDEKGYLYISGRKKEMINRGGENIYPREIEIPLEKHPKIMEVAVVGIPDPALGERVMACIIPHEGCTITAEEVKDYLSDKIAKYKIPEVVKFMSQFPRTPTGKVMKQELKALGGK